ncbi:hypothetical protein [Serratia rhizosphaerae]|uniref:Uncharacterized protein n=1 Tax=Serratia rhizosphaerae TaxID=2597702 RepID=A0ABX6GTF3_9GAMM|nr:hypothetical protein [Serratia rhizosphaerae]QHA89559.1 hypothetical protein FO014_22650 [Serratia rhizosphaerae]
MGVFRSAWMNCLAITAALAVCVVTCIVGVVVVEYGSEMGRWLAVVYIEKEIGVDMVIMGLIPIGILLIGLFVSYIEFTNNKGPNKEMIKKGLILIVVCFEVSVSLLVAFGGSGYGISNDIHVLAGAILFVGLEALRMWRVQMRYWKTWFREKD